MKYVEETPHRIEHGLRTGWFDAKYGDQTLEVLTSMHQPKLLIKLGSRQFVADIGTMLEDMVKELNEKETTDGDLKARTVGDDQVEAGDGSVSA